VRNIWNAIHDWLRQYAPEVLEELRPPAARSDLQRCESPLGFSFPVAFRESLAVHDGTSPSLGLLGGRELLALPQAELVWREYLRPVRPPRNSWWPVAQDPNQGHAYFICLEPTGRLVTSWHYRDAQPIVVAPSFQEWLADLLTDMTAGQIGIEGSHLKLSETGAFSWPEMKELPFIAGPG
jgi:cell wall assembly regulator SMI1